MPIILGPDGPSLGGFVCPFVAAAERWKLGQLAPGDSVRLVPWSPEQAAAADRHRRAWVARATARIEPVARPAWNERHGRAAVVVLASVSSPVLARRPATANEPEVTYRRAGDRFVLVGLPRASWPTWCASRSRRV